MLTRRYDELARQQDFYVSEIAKQKLLIQSLHKELGEDEDAEFEEDDTHTRRRSIRSALVNAKSACMS